MRRTSYFVASLLLVCTVAFAENQASKQKTKGGQGTRPVLGTVQMPGDNGKIGTTYSMGDKDDQLNFTLESAEFALRAGMVEDTIVANKEQKLLVMTFTVQNPLKRDMHLDYGSFKFTAVAPDDQNSEFDGWIYHPDRKTRFDTTLKPAQKVKALMVFPIHAKGPVNKLIVKRGANAPVLRYDLRKAVKPLKGAFAAAEGVDATEEAQATIGTAFPLGQLDWTVEKVEDLGSKVGNYSAEEGQKIYAVTVIALNPNMKPEKAAWNSLKPSLVDENGEEMEWQQDLLSLSSNKTIDQELKPGAFVKGRFIFIGGASAKPTTLTLADPGVSERSVSVKF